MSKSFFLKRCAAVIILLSIAACSPQYDWRDVRGTNAPFKVLMPAKPASHSRPVNIGGTEVIMTMTAAEVDGVTFAVGVAELPDAAQAVSALNAMKMALVKNIAGTVKMQKSSSSTTPPRMTIDMEAVGAAGPDTDGHPRLLIVRLVAQDRRVYQALVVGREPAVSRDAVDTFLTSFEAR